MGLNYSVLGFGINILEEPDVRLGDLTPWILISMGIAQSHIIRTTTTHHTK